MRKDRVISLAQFLESLDDNKFDMNNFYAYLDRSEMPQNLNESEFLESANECGTTACIAGWGVYMMHNEFNCLFLDRPDNDPEKKDFRDILSISAPANKVARYLGIGYDVAGKLFYADKLSIWERYADKLGLDRHYGEIDWYSITPAKAAIVLRMIANNEIPEIIDGKLVTDWVEP